VEPLSPVEPSFNDDRSACAIAILDGGDGAAPRGLSRRGARGDRSDVDFEMETRSRLFTRHIAIKVLPVVFNLSKGGLRWRSSRAATMPHSPMARS
jgi:hypothetical protein